METPVLVSFISGGFAIVSPILAFIATKYYEKRYLQPINPDRRDALVGIWSGQITQPNLTVDIELELNVSRKEIIGEAQIKRIVEGKQKIIVLNLNGGFYYDRFLKLDYKNADRGTIQFGSVTLELAAEPKYMEGKYSGYGSVNNSIVFGEIHLNKIDS